MSEPTSLGDLTRKIELNPPDRVRRREKAWSSWAKLYKIDVSEPPTLWEGLLPKEDIALLAGDPGAGKSTLVRKLCEAIVNHEESFLGLRLHPRYWRVTYVSCEDTEASIARAVQGSGSGRSGDDTEAPDSNVAPQSAGVVEARLPQHENLRYLWGHELSLPDIIKEVEYEIAEHPVDMVVFDSVGNMMQGDQNRNSDVQVFYKRFANIASKTLCLFLHHLKKHTREMDISRVLVQGGGAFVQRPRAVLLFAGADERPVRYLWMGKENLGIERFKSHALTIHYHRDTRSLTADKEPLSIDDMKMVLAGNNPGDLRELFEPGESQLSTSQIRERAAEVFGIAKRTIAGHLASMVQAGTLFKVRHGYYSTQPPLANQKPAVQALVNQEENPTPTGLASGNAASKQESAKEAEIHSAIVQRS